MSKMFSFKALLPTTLAALLIAFTTTIQFPLEIFLNNLQEFTLALNTMVPVFAIAFCTVFTVFFLPALIPFNTFRDRYFSFIATLALLMWFNANFMFGNYGAFDERGLVIPTTSLRAISEVIIWIVLLILSVIFSLKIKKIQFQAVTLLLILSVLLTGFQAVQYLRTESKPSAPKELFNEEFLSFSTERNIIHIVLDEMQSTITETLIEENPLYREKLDGFTYFPNTASVYPSTVMSIPLMLSGDVYRNEMDKLQFTANIFNKHLFFQHLEQANYRIDTHTLPRFCELPNNLKNCTAIPPKPANKTSLTLLDYSFFKAVPDTIKPKIYREGRWWLSDRFVIQDHSAIEPGVGHLVFTEFNKNIVARDIPPTYKFYHTFISHAPTLLDANCDILIERASSKSFHDRKEQGACAYKHVFAFIDKLKSLDVYDNTMIIISSDHGSVYVSDALEQELVALKLDPEHYSTGLATLLIKPFNSHGLLKESLAPASLADIPNTILTTLDLLPVENGENIFRLAENEPRDREYLYYVWENKYWRTVTLPPLNVYSIKGDIRDPNAWTYKETIPERKTFDQAFNY